MAYNNWCIKATKEKKNKSSSIFFKWTKTWENDNHSPYLFLQSSKYCVNLLPMPLDIINLKIKKKKSLKKEENIKNSIFFFLEKKELNLIYWEKKNLKSIKNYNKVCVKVYNSVLHMLFCYWKICGTTLLN